MTTFRIFDHNGNILRTEAKQFNHKRYSCRCAAQQKFLNSLFCEGGSKAEIEEKYGAKSNFLFVNGISQHYFAK